MLGQQQPRLSSVPDYGTSAGQEAIELAEVAGLTLDPWQKQFLTDALGERADGKWAAFEVAAIVARQNGKNAIVEARELAGLFLFGEEMLTHSAHQFDTSLEAFRRLLRRIETTPELESQIKRVSRSHGEEGIELKGGNRIRFRTRTRGGGRGFSGDLIVLDEAMVIPEAAMASLLPTLSARPNPQVWYLGSAVDQNVHEHSMPFTRARERGIKGEDPRLLFAEWSLDTPLDEISDQIESDPAEWAKANPALGIRLSEENIEAERRALSPRDFAVERLGVGDWPSLEEDEGDGITRTLWHACEDPNSVLQDPVSIAFDVTPSRMRAAIVAAGFNQQGLPHVEVIAHQSGTAWLPAKLEELVAKHSPGPVALGARSPALPMASKLTELGIPFEVVDLAPFASACATFFDDVRDGRLRHLGTGELQAAALGARERPYGDAWTWTRRASSVDISPLVAATLAYHVANVARVRPKRSGRAMFA